MKTRLLIVIAAAIVSGIFSVAPASAGVQNFTFSDANFTYDLTRQRDGSSRLDVTEEITANFPDFNQNKGISRAIPRTNQDGKNVVFPKQQVQVTRNGDYEPIYETDQDNNYFYLSTGTESYLRGDQVFGFKYFFTNVITEFAEHQELYWDVNGNDSSQPFIGGVTDTINLDDAALQGFTGDVVCYTGRYGRDTTDCYYDIIGNTITVSSYDTLEAYETLTFALKFELGTFVIPDPPVSRTPFVIGVLATATTIAILSIYLCIYYVRIITPRRENKKFVKPEYQPPKDVSVLTSSSIHSKPGTSPLSAFFIDLAVRGNIIVSETEKKGLFGTKSKQFSLELVNRNGLRDDEIELVDIFFADKNTYDIKPNTSTTFSRKLSTWSLGSRKRIVKLGYFIKKQRTFAVSMLIFFQAICLIMLFVSSVSTIEELVGYTIVGWEWTVVGVVASIASIITMSILNNSYNKYVALTPSGWELYYYLLGLEEYIKLAETDRIAFHQSVKGAERIATDDASLVKLYEKLLPYAMIFGLEKSWGKAIEIHAGEAYSPSWYSGSGTMNTIIYGSMISSFNSSVRSYYGSSGGGGSSSSSGSGFSSGGGGGFSGGGGGGGGFGGR